jgi:6-phosphogluconate dehydrogenase
MVVVPDGDPVEECLAALSGVLDKGDVIIDSGNSHYRDTERRQNVLSGKGFHLLGLGVSGGLDGARHGPSLMAGGPAAAWRRAGPILETIAARAGREPCAGHLGEGGAGHFVKMVHNGIEYAILQILADVFDLLGHGCGMDAGEIAKAFGDLNAGPAAGFLVEASESIVASPDEAGTGFLIDAVDDRADHNRTGKWAVEAAMDFGVAAPTIAAAVQFRALSANELLRSKAKDGPAGGEASRSLIPDDVTPLLISGVTCAMASVFQQGFALFDAAGDHFGSALDKRRIASLWRSGCILRGGMVDLIEESQDGTGLRLLVADGIEPLRELSVAALSIGLPVPGLSTALGYVDALRRSQLSTRFIQLHRDYFGGHGFRRMGQGALLHGPWREDDDQ